MDKWSWKPLLSFPLLLLSPPPSHTLTHTHTEFSVVFTLSFAAVNGTRGTCRARGHAALASDFIRCSLQTLSNSWLTSPCHSERATSGGALDLEKSGFKCSRFPILDLVRVLRIQDSTFQGSRIPCYKVLGFWNSEFRFSKIQNEIIQCSSFGIQSSGFYNSGF